MRPIETGRRRMNEQHASHRRDQAESAISVSELNTLTRCVLARMMAGLSLSLFGFFLALCGSSQAIAANHAGGVWAVPLGLLLLVLVLLLWIWLRADKSHTDDNSSPTVGPNGSDQDDPSPAGCEHPAPVIGEIELHRLVSEQIRRCSIQSSVLGIIGIHCDRRGQQIIDQVQRSLLGLARSRGARLLRRQEAGLLVLAPGQRPEQALDLAEDINQGLISMAVPAENAPLGITTASIALVLAHPSARHSASSLLEAVDKTLETARSQGGNRIEVLEHYG
ncbi:MAG: diguanylate cyclase [Wenzhouxiangellaceae bacterium]|nr:MAG: diguanylate cyclase [Wenzhouxiangellaceae bacterium]